MTRYVNVRRTVVAFYRVPADIEHYGDLTEDEIKDYELQVDYTDPETSDVLLLDNIVDSKVEVWFDDRGDE